MKILFSFPITNLTEFYKFYKGISIESLGYKKAYLVISKENASVIVETNYFNSRFDFLQDGLKVVDFQIPKDFEEFGDCQKLIYKIDLPKFLTVVEKFTVSAPKEHILTFLFQDRALVATDSFKKNKIQVTASLEDIENYEEIEEKVDKFIEKFVKEPKTLNFESSEFIDKLVSLKNISVTNGTKSNSVELTNKCLKYGDNYSVVEFREDGLELAEDKDVKLCTEAITFIQKGFNTLSGFHNIDVSESNKFVALKTTYLKGIYAQKPQVFNFPAPEVLDWIAPNSEEGWEFKFSGNTFKREIANFKSLFSENSWKWQPISFKINREDTSKIILEYQDPTAREEVELPITDVNFRGFEDVSEYSFYVPSQIVASILGFGLERLSEEEYKETGDKFRENMFQMNVIPISELEIDESLSKFKGFTISLAEAGMKAVFCKTERK